MAYQSILTAKASSKTGSGYKSIFGITQAVAPSQQQLADQRAQKKAQDDADRAQKQAQQQQQAKQDKAKAQSNSLFGKVKRNVIDPLASVGAKTLNTAGAATASVVGSGIEAVQDVTGHKAAAKRTSAATKQEIKQFEEGGVGGAGGYYNPKAIKAAGGDPNSFKNKYLKPSAQAVTDIAPLIIPAGKVVKGASLATKVVRGAADNALVGAGSTAANEVIQGRLKKDNGGEIVKAAAVSGIIGGLFPVVHGSAAAASTKEAKLFLNRAKQDDLLAKVRPPEKPPAVPETVPQPVTNSLPAGMVPIEARPNAAPAEIVAQAEASKPVVSAEALKPVEATVPVSKEIAPIKNVALLKEVDKHDTPESFVAAMSKEKSVKPEAIATGDSVRLKTPTGATTTDVASGKVKELGVAEDGTKTVTLTTDKGDVTLPLHENTTVTALPAHTPEELQTIYHNAKNANLDAPTPISQTIAEKRTQLEAAATKSAVPGKPTVAAEIPAGTKTTPKVDEVAHSKFKSRVYERLQKEQPETLKDDVGYKAINLKEDAGKAADIVATDKNKAYRIAMGVENDASVTSTAVNIAMSEKALEEGNVSLYSQLVKSRSLTQTRRGQEIVAEKGSVTDNSTARYVKELLQSRLSKLGKGYLDNLGDDVAKVTRKGNTPAQRAVTVIDKKVAEAQKTVHRSGNLKIQQAQDLIDSLAC